MTAAAAPSAGRAALLLGPSMLLSKDAILAADDLPRELVDVPEWGGQVWVRALTGAEKNAFEEAGIRFDGKKAVPVLNNAAARLAALSCCDERGQRLFGDAEVEALGKKSGAALERIFAVAARLSRLTARDAEDAEKNSAPGPACGST